MWLRCLNVLTHISVCEGVDVFALSDSNFVVRHLQIPDHETQRLAAVNNEDSAQDFIPSDKLLTSLLKPLLVDSRSEFDQLVTQRVAWQIYGTLNCKLLQWSSGVDIHDIPFWGLYVGYHA